VVVGELHDSQSSGGSSRYLLQRQLRIQNSISFVVTFSLEIAYSSFSATGLFM
jgi:hypothetical protein